MTDRDDLAWVEPRVVRPPFGTFDEPAQLASEADARLPCTYNACIEPASGSFGQFTEHVRHRADWTYREPRTGHNAMMSVPVELARPLLAAGGGAA